MDLVATVTTAPRSKSYLGETIRSLRNANILPITFAEPDSDLHEVGNSPTICNSTKLGAWNNWKSSIKEALNTKAAWILSCQDDITVHPEILELLSVVVKNLPDFGYISLYTPTHYCFNTNYQIKPSGISKMEVRSAYGACALLFPRKTLVRMVELPLWEKWLGVPAALNPLEEFQRRKEDPSTIKHVDAAIPQALIQLELPMYYFMPSVCQHIGFASALSHQEVSPELLMGSSLREKLKECLGRSGLPLLEGLVSRRYAQFLADYTKPLIPQVFPNVQNSAIPELVRSTNTQPTLGK